MSGQEAYQNEAGRNAGSQRTNHAQLSFYRGEYISIIL